ncbi:IS30 family transposase, partial [Weissella kandleri]|uniref:IS30 family transposase n=1 Tax=Weissella kandleri TaxID=1616 RepID=UPI00387E4333
MSTSTLSQYERGAIYQLLKDGFSQNLIAKKLNRSKLTISYELHRVDKYDPILAQNDADFKRTKCGRKTILSSNYARIIKNHLQLTWSPEQIAIHFHLCTKSIYNWIDKGMLDFNPELIPDKARRRKRQNETRGTFKINATIDQRPEAANKRTEFGHWEVDTVLSSRGQSKECLATFVERHSRFLWAIKIKNRSRDSM